MAEKVVTKCQRIGILHYFFSFFKAGCVWNAFIMTSFIKLIIEYRDYLYVITFSIYQN